MDIAILIYVRSAVYYAVYIHCLFVITSPILCVLQDLVASGQVSSMSAHPPDIQTEAFPHEAQVVSIEIPDTNGQSDKMAAESITPHDFQQELPVPDRLIPREEGPPSYLEACASIGVGEHMYVVDDFPSI